jgi:hypothetical protein
MLAKNATFFGYVQRFVIRSCAAIWCEACVAFLIYVAVSHM